MSAGCHRPRQSRELQPYLVSSGCIAMTTEGSCSNVEERLKKVHKECDDTFNGWSPTPRGRASSNGGHEVDREGGIGGENTQEKDDSDLSSFMQGTAPWKKPQVQQGGPLHQGREEQDAGYPRSTKEFNWGRSNKPIPALRTTTSAEWKLPIQAVESRSNGENMSTWDVKTKQDEQGEELSPQCDER